MSLGINDKKHLSDKTRHLPTILVPRMSIIVFFQAVGITKNFCYRIECDTMFNFIE